jgi:hypothetical protein
MPFQKDKTGALQTATNAATNIVVAGLTSGAFKVDGDDFAESVFAEVEDLTTRIFEPLAAQVDEDNEMFKKNDSGGGSRSGGSRSGGGKGKGRSGGGSVETDGSMEMSWGAFKGETIADIYEMSADEASEYGYESGSGKKYVTWLSKNTDNEYAAKRAKAFLDAKKNGSDE